MPSRKTRFAVFDTSVYIENFRTGRFARRVLESPYVPRCSAVVLHELLRGALSARSLGATLATCNEADFRAIGRHVAFEVAFWE